jgi:hypothetical protein
LSTNPYPLAATLLNLLGDAKVRLELGAHKLGYTNKKNTVVRASPREPHELLLNQIKEI